MARGERVDRPQATVYASAWCLPYEMLTLRSP